MESNSGPIIAQTHVDPTAAPWMKRVPMITGVLAGLAGFLTVKGANLSNQAIYHSNQAVLHQAQASDHWTQYQADSVKRHIDDTALIVGVADPSAKASLQAESKTLHDRQAPLASDAGSEELLRTSELQNAAQLLSQKDLLDYAGVGAQIGIALASIAALTKKKAAFNAGVVLGLVAVLITGYAIASPILIRFFVHR